MMLDVVTVERNRVIAHRVSSNARTLLALSAVTCAQDSVACGVHDHLVSALYFFI